MDDKEIIKCIRDKNSAELCFLDECWYSSENENFLGFYYFYKEYKNDVDAICEVFNTIVSRFNSESYAFFYLGEIATKIYNKIFDQHISSGFYRKSIELDNNNSEAHWKLYIVSGCVKSFFNALEIDYKNKKFNDIEEKLKIKFPKVDQFIRFSFNDLLFFEKIIEDDRVLVDNKIKIIVYFYLEKYEKGLDCIFSNENKIISFSFLKIYYDIGLLDKEDVLSKIHHFEKARFLGDDYKLIYREDLKESKKEKSKITSTLLIKSAFFAEEFYDVIQHYGSLKENELSPNDLISHQCYILSQLFLNDEINEIVLDKINKIIKSEGDVLSEVIEFKLKTKKLNELILTECSKEDPIDYISFYQDANKLLNSSCLLDFNLYDRLVEERDSIKKNWNKSYYEFNFLKNKKNYLDKGFDEVDLLEICNLGIECEEYDFVIKLIFEYHKNHYPNISSCNSLAVCYQRKKEYEKALEQYKLALDIMLTSKDKNHIVIRNYIICHKLALGENVSDDKFETLKKYYNASLTDSFKWDYSIAKNHGSLYKYTSFNVNTIDSLINEYFYLAGKDKLNDPIEFPELKKMKEDNLIELDYRICSLSNNENSMLMWSHYAQEHQGIMIEYWFGGEFPEGVGVEKVSYTDDIKRNKEKDLYVFNQYVLTKNKDWTYEEEVRIFSNKIDKVSFENYDYPNHDRNKINSMINSITLGYKFPDDKKSLVKNMINSINNKRKSYEPKILIREAYMSEENSFSLKYREVEF